MGDSLNPIVDAVRRTGGAAKGAELTILCGVAIGYPDPDFPANKLHSPRNPIEENRVLLGN